MLEKEYFIVMVIIAISCLVTTIWLFVAIRSIRFQKRIGNHVITNTSLEDISIFDQISNRYHGWKQKTIKRIEEIKLWRYLILSNTKKIDRMSSISIWIDKGLSSIFLMTIYLFFSVLGILPFNILFLLITGIFGFSLLHLIATIKKRITKQKIENDLLKAISLMNNAFQSGKSMIQAIQTVAVELEGPLAVEFSKIHQDMLHGLSFETAFLRFQNRVNIEEINYITASLSILNKTGGNIKEVFNAIENNFYTRRKLEMELKATIASSRLVFQFLIFLPIFLWGAIGFMNSSYFTIFFQSTLGMLLFIIILCIYLIYIIMIRDIMKVEKY